MCCGVGVGNVEVGEAWGLLRIPRGEVRSAPNLGRGEVTGERELEFGIGDELAIEFELGPEAKAGLLA